MYTIVSYYHDERYPKRTVKRGVTLEEAQAHCHDPETHSNTATSARARARTRARGVWFDGYEEIR